MKIILTKGSKCPGDKIIKIETNGQECFTHARLMTLLNQLSINEYLIYKAGHWDERGKDFLFPLAVEDAIEKGRQGINFLDDKYEEDLRKFCEYHNLRFYEFKQTKLEDFKDESS